MFFINLAHVRGVLGKFLVFLVLVKVYTLWSSVTNLTDEIVTDLLAVSETKRSKLYIICTNFEEKIWSVPFYF